MPEQDQNPPDICPCCKHHTLEVDEEYMLSTFGAAYVYMPWRQWSFFCTNTDCEEAEIYTEMEEIKDHY